MDIKKYFERATELKNRYSPFVTVTITGVRGSAPQDLGAKMIVTESGLDFGTVGGGKVEAHCLNYAQDFINGDKLVEAQTWNLQKDIGMTCGGEVTFLFELCAKRSPWHIAIFGAGHISQELCPILSKLDCHLYVIDNRKEWLDKIVESTNMTKYHLENMDEALSLLPDNCFVGLMTMGHAYDVPILEKALVNHKFPYLAVIGSQSKRNRMELELKDRGLSQDLIKSFICPIGEDFGSNHPVEIALSISAQLIKSRDQLKNA